MEILKLDDFLKDIKKHKTSILNLTKYESYEYECACGEKHPFFKEESEVLAQSNCKLLIGCPCKNHLITYVYLKPKFLTFGFKGFETLCGVELNCLDKSPEILKQAIKTAFLIKGH